MAPLELKHHAVMVVKINRVAVKALFYMLGETNLLCTLKEYFTHNICQKHRFSSPTTIDPASFDEKGAAAVAVIPKESEFGCTFRDGDKIDDILTTGARVFNSENMGDSEFQETKVVEEVSMDSLSDGEKQDKCCEEYESKLHNLHILMKMV